MGNKDRLMAPPETVEQAQVYSKLLIDIISETFPAFAMTLHQHDDKWGAWIFVGVEIYVVMDNYEVWKLAEQVIETVRPHVEPMLKDKENG